MQFSNMQAHLNAQLGIQVGEGFIKHKHPWITHDGATDRHALALAAGKLLRFAIQQMRELQRFRHHFNLAANFIFWHFIHLQAIAHIFRYRHMRVERIGLEYHGDAAMGRNDIIHHLIANKHFTFAHLFETGNHSQ